MNDRGPTPLEERLGYVFADAGLLSLALTHASAGAPKDNQRLEFLGDALLAGALTLLIYQEKPAWDEGQMSKLRHLLIGTEALHAWASELGVALRVGPGKRGSTPSKTSFHKPLADAMEALLAAVFLDHRQRGGDGISEVGRLVAARFRPQIQAADERTWQRHDPKTTLQERAAVLGLSHPAYRLMGQAGPDHAPRFEVEVVVGERAACGEGGNRRKAEAAAAARMLALLDSP
jgi:ribonuclease-3